MLKKAKVAIVRGTSLNPWEARCFELLQKDFQVLGVTSLGNKYDLSRTTLPIKRLFCPGEVLGLVAGGTQFLYKFFGSPQILHRLEEMITGCDVVETAEITNYYTYQVVCAKKKGLVGKVGLTIWENIPFNQEGKPKTREIAEFVITNADFFIAGTKSAYQSMLVHGIPEAKIVDIIPMSEDTHFFKKERKVKKRKEFVFLCASRLVWEKGVQDAIFALKLLISQYNNVRLLIVGEGRYEKDLRCLVKKLNLLSYVSFKNQIPYYDLPDLYNNVDAFILPSLPAPFWKEQFGMTILQAMACEVPVIGSTSGSIPELVENCGLLYPAGDILKLSQCMKKLVSNTKLYQDLVKAGRERVKKFFDYRVVAQKRLVLYHKLLL